MVHRGVQAGREPWTRQEEDSLWKHQGTVYSVAQFLSLPLQKPALSVGSGFADKHTTFCPHKQGPPEACMLHPCSTCSSNVCKKKKNSAHSLCTM